MEASNEKTVPHKSIENKLEIAIKAGVINILVIDMA
jgi:hypothetical protein